MVHATEWIGNLVKTAKKESTVLTPFQFDLCIAVGEPETKDEMVGTDDDDDANNDDGDNDDDDQKEPQYVDYIGNIAEKLKNNKSRNTKKEIKAKDAMNRVFDDLYKQFLEENDEPDEVNKFSYLQRKRLISMVDRRHQSEDPEVKDSIFMYEPPADSQIIPKNAVPEWFVASSRECLLPGLDVCSRIFREHILNESIL